MTKRVSNNKPLELTVFNYCVRLLAQSSRDLAARFGQQRTVDGQLALVREELAEVLAATDDAHRVEELCDLVVVTCGLVDATPKRFMTCIPIVGEGWKGISISEFELAIKGAILLYQNGLARHNPSTAIRDMLLTVWCLCRTIPNAAELFPAQVAAVVAKNAAKSDATHYLDSETGKITRKVQS